MNKLELIFNFTIRAIFWGVLCCVILGAVGSWLNGDSVVSGIMSSIVAGVMVGIVNGLVIGILTARYFHPLKTRRNYDLKLTFFGSTLTLILMPLTAIFVARQSNSDAVFAWMLLHLLMWIISAPIIGYFVTAWYLKTHTPIE